LITIIKYTDKQLIDEQYSKITTMRIIFKGSVQLFLILQDNSRINLSVLEQGDYFGEQIYFNKHLYSYFSVEAIGDVQIGFVPAPEFYSLTGSRVVMQDFTIKSQDQYELDLQLLYREQNKTWSVLRKQQMTKLLKEWKNEPNIDYKRWIHENNKVL
jgi:CRP-like cAMP-binding protein